MAQPLPAWPALRETAITFMHLIRDDDVRAARRRACVIPAARRHGLSIAEIVAESGVPAEQVELILRSADTQCP